MHRKAASSYGPAAVTAAAMALASLVVPATSSAAPPEFAVALRAGTPGLGLDLDLGLSPMFGVRIGYSGFNINHSIDTDDVDYSGKLKLSMGTALLDWYPFEGVFHLTGGVAANDTKLDVVGQPSAGTYTINGNTYTRSQIGSLTGQLKFGNSVAPYVGFGWGNPTGANGHIHFLLDIGAIYGGTPSVSLTAQCGSAAPSGSPVCDQAQANVATEQQKLRNKADFLRWYPVLNLGVAVRF
jgi:hypothetical protein